MSDDLPNTGRRWKNMRRMAWIGIVSCGTWPFILHLEPNLMEITTGWFSFWGWIIGAYMGASTARDGWGKK